MHAAASASDTPSASTPSPSPHELKTALSLPSSSDATPVAASPPTPSTPLCGPAAVAVVALYDYAARNEVELGFRSGDVLRVMQRDSADWWLARREAPAAAPAGQTQTQRESGQIPAVYVAPVLARGRALYDFTPSGDAGSAAGQLPLRAGDEVLLTHMPDGGWWEGFCQRTRGVMPANYVQLDAE